MLQHIAKLQTRLTEDEGATAVEYGLLVALIAAVIIATVITVGQDVLRGFTTVATNLPG
jgi:pilus assembly protein Flp/PilA